MITGLVSHIQRFSLHDGPGIRTTVFLKGCPLRCAWCHNPENQSPHPERMVIGTRCVRCGQCQSVCPVHNDAKACQLCGACVAACPADARQLLGQWQDAGRLVQTLLADRIFFEESGGGITFSGGEPLMQSQFLATALTALRHQGIHTTVDTCGYASRPSLESIIPNTSLFLYDIKFIRDADHQEFTGVSNQKILDNLEWLAEAHGCIWLRCPIIPGVNDSESELEAKAELARSLPAVRQVNLLPYHRTGLPKFARLGLSNRLQNTEPPTRERMMELAGIFQAHGLNVKIGG